MTAALALLLAGLPAYAAPAAAVSPIGKGWGWALAAGIISGVDLVARTVTLVVGGQGELEMLVGDGLWRREPVAGAQVVHVLPSTVLSGPGDPFGTIGAIHPGMPATVWAVVRADAAMLGVKIVVGSGDTRPSVVPSAAAAISGVVLRRSAGTILILTPQGAPRGIIVTTATALRNGGAVLPVSAIGAYDVLRIEGAVNSDGSVAATRIDLDMQASAASQASGPITRLLANIEGLMVGGVAVAVAPGCYFIQRAGSGAFKDLAVGQRLQVYGTPIALGATPVGLRARVIVER